MSACEICWQRASMDVLLRGGSVVDRYRARVAEQETNPTHLPVALAVEGEDVEYPTPEPGP